MILNLLRKRFKYIMFYLFDIQRTANVTAPGALNLGRDFFLHSFLYLLNLEPYDSITYFYHVKYTEIKAKFNCLELKLSWFVFHYLNS